MGSQISSFFDTPFDAELNQIKACLAQLLHQLTPEELLIFAVEDKEVYDICKSNAHLRQMCIVAAVRKYHTEKFFYAEVHNRTADYMVMLDQLVKIQDEYDMQEFTRKSLIPCFPWFLCPKQDRIGDAIKNGHHKYQ